MPDLFMVAGLPSTYAASIDARTRKRIVSETGELLVVPMLPGLMKPTYNSEYRDQLLRACSNWVEKRPLDDSFSISLLYARRSSQDVSGLLQDFFPFALVCEFPAPRIVYHEDLIRREVKRLSKHLAPRCSKLRTQAKIIREHLSSCVRHTPLLLPPRNFGSANLNSALLRLLEEAVCDEPADSLIKAIIKDFEKTATRKKNSGSLHYVNNDGLIFVAPKYEQFHGHARPSDHPWTCHLGGRARLGGSYNPRFHYDCRPLRGTLKREYASCHEQQFAVMNRSYLNVAPNDNIR